MLARWYWPAVAAGAVTTAIESAAVVRGRSGAAFTVLALLVLVAAAALLARDPEQRGNARLLEFGAVAAAVSDLDTAVGRIGVQIAFTTHFWAPVTFACFFLRYPDRVVRVRWHRYLIGWLVLAGVLAWAVNSLLWDPTRIGDPEPNDWITVGDWNGVRDQIQLWSVWGVTLGLLAGAVGLVQRWRAAHGFERAALRSTVTVGVLLAVVVATTEWVERIYARYVAVALPDLGSVREAALGLATVAVLIEALRRRSASVAVVDELFGAGGDPRRTLDTLRRAFADPVLSVHLDDGPEPASGRIALPLLGRGGEAFGAVDTDASALRDPAWTRTVLAAAGVVMENTRLHADVVESLAEVHRSRARIVEAALDERRRVERDLHDGAQQHLLAVASSLGRLELLDDDRARQQAIHDAKAQLGTALAELRRLARGIYPPVLTQAGLGAALRTLPDTTAVRVRLELDPAADRRYRPAVESTAWFVACEAVANAVKHAGAGEIVVRLHASVGALEVSVRDDGGGGARIDAGGGLAGLRDRVNALGGSLLVRAGTGAGTEVTAVIPVPE